MKDFLQEHFTAIYWSFFVIIMVIITIGLFSLSRQSEEDKEMVPVMVTNINVQEGHSRRSDFWDLAVDVVDCNGQQSTWEWHVNPSISLQTLEDFEWLKEGEMYTAERSKSDGTIFRLYLLQEGVKSQ